jgi:hypothetical protein
MAFSKVASVATYYKCIRELWMHSVISVTSHPITKLGSQVCCTPEGQPDDQQLYNHVF